VKEQCRRKLDKCRKKRGERHFRKYTQEE